MTLAITFPQVLSRLTLGFELLATVVRPGTGLLGLGSCQRNLPGSAIMTCMVALVGSIRVHHSILRQSLRLGSASPALASPNSLFCRRQAVPSRAMSRQVGGRVVLAAAVAEAACAPAASRGLERLVESSAVATPVEVVAKGGLEGWLAGQPETVAAWANAVGFKAKEGEVLLVPSAQVQCTAGVVVRVGGDAFLVCACLGVSASAPVQPPRRSTFVALAL